MKKVVIILAVYAAFFWLCKCNLPNRHNEKFNRHPETVQYSHHAKCRMDCRHITDYDVKTLIEKGDINYDKSELTGEDCNKRFAIEGTVHDSKLRIIVAPCGTTDHVITCIDLDKEWSCNCEEK